MEILLINGSPRKGGNTEIMVDAFIEGARESGNTVTKFNLASQLTHTASVSDESLKSQERPLRENFPATRLESNA